MIAPLPHPAFRRLLSLAALAFLLLAYAPNTQAQNNWTGNQSSDWNNSGNWSYGSVPTSGTAVTIYPQSTQDRGYWRTSSYSCGSWPFYRTCYYDTWVPVYYYPPTPYVYGGTITCGSLTISNTSLNFNAGSNLTVNGDLTINNGGPSSVATLTVSGNINCPQTNLNLGSGGLILNGTGNQTLSIGNSSLALLTIDKPSGVASIGTNLSITSRLSLTRGMLQTSASSAITIPAGATVVGEGAGHYVKGNLIAQASNVSGLTTFGNGVTINATSQLGNVTVKRTAGLQAAGVSYAANPKDGLLKGIDQIWEITPQNQPGAPVAVTFTWTTDNDNLLDLTKAQVWKQETSADPWGRVGPVANATAHTITVSTGSFSRWTVSNVANPLPVQLLSFTAEAKGNDALMRWATASEINSRHFALEVSTDGKQFQSLARITAQGNSSTRHEYQYTDAVVARYGTSQLYYRLRQVDLDGTEAISSVAPLRIARQPDLMLQAFPNPFNDQLTMRVASPVAESATFTVHDAMGRVLLSQPVLLESGTTNISLPAVYNLAPGLYVLTVQTKTQKTVAKVYHQ
ncbi:T9SS type A sorting domain-containing protein [Hymenobacter rubripertinctus]|nr:T9SS type A sorting domain-containing protein [Hymenobacter rubripertinctus]